MLANATIPPFVNDNTVWNQVRFRYASRWMHSLSLVDVSTTMYWNENLRIGKNRDGGWIAMVCIASFIAFLAYVARLSDVTHDAFHEMALVREFFRTGVFPHDDLFAFTPTVRPVVHHEWGTGLFLYWVAGASPLGLHGMAIARTLLIAALGLVLYRVARNNGAHPIVFALCAPIAFPLAWVGFATLRAQLFTLLFLGLQILLQQSDWRGSKRWVVPWIVLYIVWLNMHAGFVVGIALLGLHVVERWAYLLLHRGSTERSLANFMSQTWHHGLLVLIIPLGLLINPWGIDYPRYLIHAILMPRPTMLEWQPLWNTHDPFLTLMAYGGMILALGYVAKNRQWGRLRGWIFCCFAAYMALKHIRHGSLFAIVWMAYLPGWLTPTSLGRSLIAWLTHYRSTVLHLAASSTIACAVFVGLHPVWKVTVPQQDSRSAMVYPVGVVQYLKQQSFHGNVLTPFSSGAYLSWECYPRVHVSLDGRYEVAYREDVLPKHDQFYSALPGWTEILREYPVDAVLVQQSAPVRPLLGIRETGTDYLRLAYEDSVFALFVLDSLSVQDPDAGSTARSGSSASVNR